MFETRGDRKQTSVSLQNSTVRSAEVLLSDKAIYAPAKALCTRSVWISD